MLFFKEREVDRYCINKFLVESEDVTTAQLPRVFGTIPSFRWIARIQRSVLLLYIYYMGHPQEKLDNRRDYVPHFSYI